MNILICDDIKVETERISDMLRDSGFDINTSVFNNAYDALAYILSGARVDACFLDIVMPEMSGVALAEKLRENGFAGEIVFLTTSNEFACESYAVKAFSYLLKPPSPDDIRDILGSLESAQLNVEKDVISVKTSSKTSFILLRDISHVEVNNHYVYFRMINGVDIEAYTTFAEVAPRLLRDSRFVRCHRSYIVNMDSIESVTRREITMRGGARIPISRSYQAVRDALLQRMLEDE